MCTISGSGKKAEVNTALVQWLILKYKTVPGNKSDELPYVQINSQRYFYTASISIQNKHKFWWDSSKLVKSANR